MLLTCFSVYSTGHRWQLRMTRNGAGGREFSCEEEVTFSSRIPVTSFTYLLPHVLLRLTVACVLCGPLCCIFSIVKKISVRVC
jgi:hypothetical protein